VTVQETVVAPTRIASLDAARGLAIVAMIVFHLIWDLGNFGYIDPAIPFSAGVKLFGHAIAIGFLVIVGMSLVLAQGNGAAAFWRRLAHIAGAATLVSLGTYLIFPQTFVFFGILHCIALASLLAAPLVARPWPTALAIGLTTVIAPLFFSNPVFDAPLLSWIGLSTITPATNDYRPVLPWTGYVFLGAAASQFWRARGLAPFGANWRIEPLNLLGRHSLLIYLVHQPALFALFWGLSAAGLAPVASDAGDFFAACELRCAEADVEAAKCSNLCACTAQRVASLTSSEIEDPERRGARLDEIARACMAEKR